MHVLVNGVLLCSKRRFGPEGDIIPRATRALIAVDSGSTSAHRPAGGLIVRRRHPIRDANRNRPSADRSSRSRADSP
jgi:hypothetical protein